MSAEQTPDIAGVASALIETDALTPNSDGTPTGYVVDAENVEYLVRTVLDLLAPVLAAAVREAEQRAWDEGCESGRLNEKAKWYWQAGNRAAMAGAGIPVERPPMLPANPYRADRVAVDAPEGGEGR